MLPRLQSLVVAVALVPAACSQELILPRESPSALSSEAAPIVADSVRYTLERTSNGWRGKIGYVFTNRTERSVSFLNCNGIYALKLEKEEEGKWVNALSIPVPECLSLPIQIAAGASVRGEVEIFAGFTGSNLHPQFMVREISGTYRLVIENVFWSYDHGGPPWGEIVPLGQRISRSFEIRT